jgi:hypothetical protein
MESSKSINYSTNKSSEAASVLWCTSVFYQKKKKKVPLNCNAETKYRNLEILPYFPSFLAIENLQNDLIF